MTRSIKLFYLAMLIAMLVLIGNATPAVGRFFENVGNSVTLRVKDADAWRLADEMDGPSVHNFN